MIIGAWWNLSFEALANYMYSVTVVQVGDLSQMREKGEKIAVHNSYLANRNSQLWAPSKNPLSLLVRKNPAINSSRSMYTKHCCY